MEKVKTIPIFRAKLAARLIEEGFIVDHTDKNRENKNKLAYYFRFCPSIYDYLNENSKKKEVRGNGKRTKGSS